MDLKRKKFWMATDLPTFYNQISYKLVLFSYLKTGPLGTKFWWKIIITKNYWIKKFGDCRFHLEAKQVKMRTFAISVSKNGKRVEDHLAIANEPNNFL